MTEPRDIQMEFIREIARSGVREGLSLEEIYEEMGDQNFNETELGLGFLLARHYISVSSPVVAAYLAEVVGNGGS